MIGNVTNLLLGLRLLAARQPNTGHGPLSLAQQSGAAQPLAVESEYALAPRERTLNFEERWPLPNEFEPQRKPRSLDEKERIRLYLRGLEMLRRPMEEELRRKKERLEREREDRLRRGESMIG